MSEAVTEWSYPLELDLTGLMLVDGTGFLDAYPTAQRVSTELIDGAIVDTYRLASTGGRSSRCQGKQDGLSYNTLPVSGNGGTDEYDPDAIKTLASEVSALKAAGWTVWYVAHLHHMDHGIVRPTGRIGMSFTFRDRYRGYEHRATTIGYVAAYREHTFNQQLFSEHTRWEGYAYSIVNDPMVTLDGHSGIPLYAMTCRSTKKWIVGFNGSRDVAAHGELAATRLGGFLPDELSEADKQYARKQHRIEELEGQFKSGVQWNLVRVNEQLIADYEAEQRELERKLIQAIGDLERHKMTYANMVEEWDVLTVGAPVPEPNETR